MQTKETLQKGGYGRGIINQRTQLDNIQLEQGFPIGKSQDLRSNENKKPTSPVGRAFLIITQEIQKRDQRILALETQVKNLQNEIKSLKKMSLLKGNINYNNNNNYYLNTNYLRKKNDGRSVSSNEQQGRKSALNEMRLGIFDNNFNVTDTEDKMNNIENNENVMEDNNDLNNKIKNITNYKKNYFPSKHVNQVIRYKDERNANVKRVAIGDIKNNYNQNYSNANSAQVFRNNEQNRLLQKKPTGNYNSDSEMMNSKFGNIDGNVSDEPKDSSILTYNNSGKMDVKNYLKEVKKKVDPDMFKKFIAHIKLLTSKNNSGFKKEIVLENVRLLFGEEYKELYLKFENIIGYKSTQNNV